MTCFFAWGSEDCSSLSCKEFVSTEEMLVLEEAVEAVKEEVVVELEVEIEHEEVEVVEVVVVVVDLVVLVHVIPEFNLAFSDFH